jgi:predicted metalloenzyme YecM
MFSSTKDFFVQARDVRNNFDQFVIQYGLVGRVEADHLCYKCDSPEVFQKVRAVLEQEAKWVYQATISKRRIASIRTKVGLVTMVGYITLVELSDQKPDKGQVNGFDHIEIYPIHGTYEGLVEHLRGQGLEVKEVTRPHHSTYDITLETGFKIRLTRESLADIIKKEIE